VVDQNKDLLKDYYTWNPTIVKDGRFGLQVEEKKKRTKMISEDRRWKCLFTLSKEFVWKHRAPLGSPVLEKGVMLGVVSFSDNDT